MKHPAVFFLLLLCACKERTDEDFVKVWAMYQPVQVAGIDSPIAGR
jgi:hypothetical protein